VARVRIGVFVSETSTEQTGVDALVAAASAADVDGFSTAWVPHIPWSLDALSAVTVAAAATERIELGTAVVPTYSRHPLAMAQQALSAQAAARGRAVLGIGPSHPIVVEAMYGLSYEHPIRHVREYVDVLDAAFAGTGQVDHDGELYRVHAMLRIPGAETMPVLLAALAPLMLRLAGERTAGTITWMADEHAHAEHVVPRITAAAEAAGAATPRVVAGLPVAVHDDADQARERAARMFAVYTQIPTYQRILDRGDASGPADVCLVGDETAVTARLNAYRDAGVTDLAASIFTVGEDREASRRRTWELLASLAPRL
jgi:5,10-methylenetetrahydromethanopterin reductase